MITSASLGKPISPKHNQVYVFMPAKAAGTSMKHFTNVCMGDGNQAPHDRDNFINTEVFFQQFLTKTLHPPPLVTNHLLGSNQPLLDLIKYGSRKSLILYLYREESDRLSSAISFILRKQLCPTKEGSLLFKKVFGAAPKSAFGLETQNNSCIVQEAPFLEHAIQARVAEIGVSTFAHWDCTLWEEIEEMGPALLVLDYREADHLQAQLAHKFCPSLQMPLQKKNVGRMNENQPFYGVRLSSTREVVSIDEWVQAKLPTIEYFLKMSGGSCKRKTRQIEDEMMSCKDHAVLLD